MSSAFDFACWVDSFAVCRLRGWEAANPTAAVEVADMAEMKQMNFADCRRCTARGCSRRAMGPAHMGSHRLLRSASHVVRKHTGA